MIITTRAQEEEKEEPPRNRRLLTGERVATGTAAEKIPAAVGSGEGRGRKEGKAQDGTCKKSDSTGTMDQKGFLNYEHI